MAEPRTAFVCGHPVAHSRSPRIHGYWLNRYNINGRYSAVDVEPNQFARFLHDILPNGYVGGNVTLPHKEAAFDSVMRRDEAAEAIGAVNTVWLEDDVLWGGNTDAGGFAANLDERAPGWRVRKVAVVLGAGGAARAVIHALRQAGFTDIRIVNRTLPKAGALADRFGSATTAHPARGIDELLADCGLLVNTTSLGMAGMEETFADPRGLPADAIVTDIVYVPLETPLLRKARVRGLRTVDGLGMLLHQAVPGFERWFGYRPEVTPELRERLLEDLGLSG